MAKFYGPVGYVVDERIGDRIVERPIERYYKGDLLENSRRLEAGEGVNDDVNISNQISIVSDPYALSHMFAIRYVKWWGTAWKVTSIKANPPRLILTLGGVYNGETKE